MYRSIAESDDAEYIEKYHAHCLLTNSESCESAKRQILVSLHHVIKQVDQLRWKVSPYSTFETLAKASTLYAPWYPVNATG
jgi:hypothetical protein